MSAVGTLEAETVRGPLIIWAKPAAKEEAPTPQAAAPQEPTPTPLEVRVSVVNTAAHFERFFRAARGKVKHSIRWKTGRKLRARLARKQIIVNGHSYLDTIIERYPLLSHYAVHHEMTISDYIFTDVGLWSQADGFTLKIFPKRTRRAIRKYKIEERQLEARRNWRPNEQEDNCTERKWTEKEIEEWRIADELHNEKFMRVLEGLESGVLPTAQDVIDIAKDNNESLLGLTPYFTPTFNDISRRTHIAFFRLLRELTGFKSIKESLLLKALEAAAYLTHVRRKVKPAPRRERIPRPIYARPRPPTAPLAPPVTC